MKQQTTNTTIMTTFVAMNLRKCWSSFSCRRKPRTLSVFFLSLVVVVVAFKVGAAFVVSLVELVELVSAGNGGVVEFVVGGGVDDGFEGVVVETVVVVDDDGGCRFAGVVVLTVVLTVVSTVVSTVVERVDFVAVV